MVIASSKNTKMPFFYLPKQHPLTLEQLPDGRFFTKEQSQEQYVYQVPFGCGPVWCEYTGDWSPEGDSWTNQITCQIHTKHSLDFTRKNSSFYEGFYEITQIEGLTFGEGEAWDPDTNEKVRVEKIVPTSVWNPFFQRYDQPCDRDEYECDPQHIKYDFVNESFDSIFNTDEKHMFFEVYCTCCRCDDCKRIHIGSCRF